MGLFGKKEITVEAFDLVSKSEKKIISKAKKVLRDSTLEGYALRIVNSYRLHWENNDSDWSAVKAEVRLIGQSIDNFKKQLLVAHRAVNLGAEQGIVIHIRELELCWDGIGGWMS